MPRYRYCVAPGCASVVTPKCSTNYKGTMHKFPDERQKPEQFQEWVRFCQHPLQWRPSSTSHICDDHFVTNKKAFKGTQVPTLPAKMVTGKCERLDDLPSNLPLDTTLELFGDESSAEPTSFCQTGLPADRTLDTTVVDFDDTAMVEEKYPSVDFNLSNIALVRIPSGWSLLLANTEVVMFGEVDKQNIQFSRFVGFNTVSGKTNSFFSPDCS